MRILLNVPDENKKNTKYLSIIETNQVNEDNVIYMNDSDETVNIKSCITFRDINSDTLSADYYVLFHSPEETKKCLKSLFETGILDLSLYGDSTLIDPTEDDMDIIERYEVKESVYF